MTGGNNNDDNLLFLRISQGDENAFKELYYRYCRKVYYFTLKCIDDSDEACEIVQSVFISLWENRASLSSTGSVKNYVYRAVVNRIINYIKKKNIHSAYIRDQLLNNDMQSDLTYQQIFYNELEKAIHSLVETLPSQQQKIFRLSRDEGMSYPEIAKKLDLSVRTVENQMYRALNTLRATLKKKYFGY